MSMVNELDKNGLLIQAENYKTFIQLNSHSLEKDRLLKEHITHRMGMLESILVELEMLERSKRDQEYNCSLHRANKILQGVKVLIEYMFNPDDPPDDSFQSIA